MQIENMEYVGFWARVGASLIDTILVGIIILPPLMYFYGNAYWTSERFIQGPADLLLTWILPAIAIMLFWVFRQATPGKMLIRAKIVDAKTGQKPGVEKLIGRYLGYFVSTIPPCLGFLWVAFDKRKQGWHDKIGGTVVVRDLRGNAAQPGSK